jgi:hypothetical protein
MVFNTSQRFLPHAIQIWKHRVTSAIVNVFSFIIIVQFELIGIQFVGTESIMSLKVFIRLFTVTGTNTVTIGHNRQLYIKAIKE